MHYQQRLPKDTGTHGFLDAIGLVALADLDTVAIRTACTGSSSFLDALVIAPGMHRQQHATELSKSEYPACAAMSTGYIFRVENQAMVYYLQKVGKTGHLTTLDVSSVSGSANFNNIGTPIAALAYKSAIGMTLFCIYAFVALQDIWALGVLGIFVFIRACNVAIVKRRSLPGWFGAPEPAEKSDLLILLSQDRWIRMQGPTDDVKAVTSGSWMRQSTTTETWITSTATLIAYLNVALTTNAQHSSKAILLALFLVTFGLLNFANQCSNTLQMHGRLVQIKHGPKSYARRRDLAEELMKETGKRHWAKKLGLLPSKSDDVEPPTM